MLCGHKISTLNVHSLFMINSTQKKGSQQMFHYGLQLDS